MKRLTGVVLIVAIAVATAVALAWRNSSDPQPEQTGSSPGAETASRSGDQNSSGRDVSQEDKAPLVSESSIEDDGQAYACPRPCELPGFAHAQSSKEAAWMARMGYPTVADLRLAQTASAHELAELGKERSSSALVILGLEKGVSTQNGMAAVLAANEISNYAIQNGSVFGLLAEARARLDLYHREPELGRATNQLGQVARLIRMGAMMGDHQILELADRIPPSEMGSNFWWEAERDASLTFQRLERLPIARLRRGAAVPRPFPEAQVCAGVAAPYAC